MLLFLFFYLLGSILHDINREENEKEKYGKKIFFLIDFFLLCCEKLTIIKINICNHFHRHHISNILFN